MKIIYCLLVMLCPALCLAQNTNGSHQDEIVPDISFANMYNYQTATASLYNFKSKLLIVEFWAGYCTACIHKFPLLDSLQQQYPDDLKVLLISVSTHDKTASISRLFKNIKNQHQRFQGLPVVLQDSIAKNYFAPKLIPHYIWLDQNFKIIAITGTDDITAEKVSGYLKGQQVVFGKKNQMDQFVADEYLFAKGNAGNGENIIARSTLSRFIPSLGSHSHINFDKAHKVTKMVFTNEPFFSLLMTAIFFYDRPERLRFQPGDSSLQIINRSDEWLIANSYTYELITPPISYDSARIIMQKDLRYYLKVFASIDTLPTVCYILEWNGKNISQNKPPAISSTRKGENGNWLFNNVSISEIAEVLDSKMDKHVIVQQQIKSAFTLELPDEKNIDVLNKSLKKYGLQLKIAELPLPNLSIHKIQN